MSISHKPTDPIFQVSAIGARGDGVILTDDGRAHIAGVLPGETVSVIGPVAGRSRLRVENIISPSPDRVTPACPHFGTCGGCALQHWADEPYRDWKASMVNQALSAVFKGTPPAQSSQAIAAWGQGRRRANLHGQVRQGEVHLGFIAARSETITNMSVCPVLDPAIEQALPMLRDLVRGLVPDGTMVDLAVTVTDAGLDISASASQPGKKLHQPEPRKLARLVDETGIARLSFDRLSAITARVPRVEMGGLKVDLPPATFLQATAAGEAALVGQVMDWAKGKVSGGRKIADLFCGIGTFALPLRTLAPVLAWEADEAAVGALAQTVSRAGGGHLLKVAMRDLYRAPVAPAELEGVDVVVLDPPRAGAEAQVAQLARMSLKRIIYASCDPVSFARDAAVLVASGYKLSAVQAFDQFLWASHVELVACFDGPEKGSASIATGAIKPLPSIRRQGQGKSGQGKKAK